MKINLGNTLGIVNTILIVAFAATYLIDRSPPKSEIRYVRLVEVYNSFDLKQDYDAKLKELNMAQQYHLDSLKLGFESAARKYRATGDSELEPEILSLRDQYLETKNQFEEQRSVVAQNYDDKIWDAINSGIKDYGEKAGVKVLLGATGSGSLMHADQQLDITDEVIEYLKNSNFETKG